MKNVNKTISLILAFITILVLLIVVFKSKEFDLSDKFVFLKEQEQKKESEEDKDIVITPSLTATPFQIAGRQDKLKDQKSQKNKENKDEREKVFSPTQAKKTSDLKKIPRTGSNSFFMVYLFLLPGLGYFLRRKA